MNRTEKGHVKVLEKRIDWLRARVAKAEAIGRDLSFDRAEYHALEWVLAKALVADAMADAVADETVTATTKVAA